MSKKMRVVFVSSECGPYVATGGLADVSEALPIALSKKWIKITRVVPKYKGIEDNFDIKKDFSFIVEIGGKSRVADVYKIREHNVTTYFIGNDDFFERDKEYGHFDDGERYGFFSKAVLGMLLYLDMKPDIIHLNDWQTGIISLLLKTEYSDMDFYKDVKVIYTIHNLQYQGVFDRELLNTLYLWDRYFSEDEVEYYGNVSFMKAGIVYSDIVSTVSETYANEIQTERYGYGLDGVLRKFSYKIRGIVNGIYYDKYDPKTDDALLVNFSKDSFKKKRSLHKKMMQERIGFPVKDVPLFGVVSRLVGQKGIDLILYAIEKYIDKDVQFVILGSGEKPYEDRLLELASSYPNKVSFNLNYDPVYAKRIYASCDFFLMPSLFEPCGLSQLYSLRYGAIPIVRNTGGLKDTIIDYSFDEENGTGFSFEGYQGDEFIEAIDRAINLYYDKKSFDKVIERGMKQRFSWSESADKYYELYKEMLEN